MWTVAAHCVDPAAEVGAAFLFSRGLKQSRFVPVEGGMRSVIEALPGSKIREVANAGIGRDDVLAFWFGESDEPTPESIRAAAVRSLHDGETFYAHNLGLPELRDALSSYVGGLHGPIGAERIAVTSSGVNALMLA